MLLEFKVRNFASLRDEQSLTFFADRHREGRSEFAVPEQKKPALAVAGVFGANAAGKSNVIRALAWMRNAVLYSFSHWPPVPSDGRPGVPRDPFLFRQDARDDSTECSVEFIFKGRRYFYGFECDDERILYEALYEYASAKPRFIFRREGADDFHFGRSFEGPRKTSTQMVRPNSLFLSAAAAQNHPMLREVYSWFATTLQVATDNNYAERLDTTLQWYLDSDERHRRFVDILLRAADLNISGIEREEDADDAVWAEAVQRLRKAFESINTEEGFVFREALAPSISAWHETDDGAFKLQLGQESSGSVTWISMLGPLVHTLASGGVLCADELDARLHPIMVELVIRLFQDPRVNSQGAQLLFNSHAHYLLGRYPEHGLHRDQIWFAEKDHRSGASTLYPLTDFEGRNDQNVELRYFGGRFGGLPFIDESAVERLSREIQRGVHGPATD
ncbi:AAA family ATPase [Salininema proteolyticum]|uniref:ATP/GTP-binding protein n=1 Tax=Salininema proteolyticum TaxID=1607685 RepID=A0ABV8U2S9_9ACTN